MTPAPAQRFQVFGQPQILEGEDAAAYDEEKLRFISSLARPNAPDIPVPVLERYLTSTPKGPQKFAIILSQEAKRLLAMDRYERRALFRRKAAIQVFDGAKAK
jgi:hypothetical protein